MTERVAFVTGGMGGIGTAICKRLAANGNKVVANCLPGYDRKEEWLASMRAQGYSVHAAEADLREGDRTSSASTRAWARWRRRSSATVSEIGQRPGDRTRDV